MAIGIVRVLKDHGLIDQAALARHFAANYRKDRARGYGATAHDILRDIDAGRPWREAAQAAFDGSGSMGNGGAMRAGPVGAYFADDLDEVVRNAKLSAEVTHAHVEGQAGAIAVAVAAAVAVREDAAAATMFEAVIAHTPRGETAAGIVRAAELDRSYDVRTAVSALGNGSRIISQDTVPFALWCAARHFDDFEEAFWTTVAGLGDRDTTCAIVGSIVGVRSSAVIPEDWIAAREPLSAMDAQFS
jgi:ADP-ribosylglycohydrolase